MKAVALALLAIARAIGRLGARGPVTHLCCMNERTLVAVIWGRLYWKDLKADWLANRWVPLGLPGDEAPPVSVSNPSVKP